MSSPPTWILAIAVIVVLQTVVASVSRFVPVIAPAFLAEFGWHESFVGYFAAAAVIGSVFVPSRYGRRFDCGTFQLAPTLLHVSRGLAGQQPVRYNCRPEVTKIVLRK